MKNSYYKLIFGALSTIAAIISSPAQAAFTWNNFSCTSGTTSACTDTTTANDVTATGWSTEARERRSSERKVSDTLVQADLIAWSGGLGVENIGEVNIGSPNHATDNEKNFDSVLFSFQEAVALTNVTMGWVQDDADISLLRYTGSTTDTPIIDGTSTYASLENIGWELVGDYYTESGNAQTFNVNPNSLTSSHWLVAAVNGTWGDNDGNLDHFKIGSIAGYIPDIPDTPQGVPEPSTLALMSISFLAFGFTQRRRRKDFPQL